jgi:hypothetical protein
VLLQWLKLVEVSGTKAAFQALANEEDAEEFARVLDDAQRHLENSAVVSIDNLLEGVSTARKGISDKPRHQMVRLLLEGKLSTCEPYIYDKQRCPAY